jgi:hypothetical protein
VKEEEVLGKTTKLRGLTRKDSTSTAEEEDVTVAAPVETTITIGDTITPLTAMDIMIALHIAMDIMTALHIAMDIVIALHTEAALMIVGLILSPPPKDMDPHKDANETTMMRTMKITNHLIIHILRALQRNVCVKAKHKTLLLRSHPLHGVQEREALLILRRLILLFTLQ